MLSLSLSHARVRAMPVLRRKVPHRDSYKTKIMSEETERKRAKERNHHVPRRRRAIIFLLGTIKDKGERQGELHGRRKKRQGEFRELRQESSKSQLITVFFPFDVLYGALLARPPVM